MDLTQTVDVFSQCMDAPLDMLQTLLLCTNSLQFVSPDSRPALERFHVIYALGHAYHRRLPAGRAAGGGP